MKVVPRSAPSACGFCRGPLPVPQAALRCVDCSAVLHRDCRKRARRCGTLGCASSGFEPLAPGTSAWEAARKGADRFERRLHLLAAGIMGTLIGGGILSLGVGADPETLAPTAIEPAVVAAPEPARVSVPEVPEARPMELEHLVQQLLTRHRDAAFELLVRHGAEATPRLLRILDESQDRRLRRELGYVLQEQSFREDLSGVLDLRVLARVIDGDDPLLVRALRQVLMQAGSPARIALLDDLLNGEDPLVRVRAALALEGLKGSLADLVAATHTAREPVPAVRALALALLAGASGADRIRVQCALQNDTHPTVQAMTELLRAKLSGERLGVDARARIAWHLVQPLPGYLGRAARAHWRLLDLDLLLAALEEGLRTRDPERLSVLLGAIAAGASSFHRPSHLQLEPLIERIELLIKRATDAGTRDVAEAALGAVRRRSTSGTRSSWTICCGGRPPTKDEVEVYHSLTPPEWVEVLVGGSLEERRQARRAIEFLAPWEDEAVRDLSLRAFPRGERYAVRAPTSATPRVRATFPTQVALTGVGDAPFHLRALRAYDVVCEVRIGERTVHTANVADLADGLRALRQARADGQWDGHVKIVRDGETKWICD